MRLLLMQDTWHAGCVCASRAGYHKEASSGWPAGLTWMFRPILAASCARRCSCILVRTCSEGQDTTEPARPAAPPAASTFQWENSPLGVGICGRPRAQF